MDYVNLTIDGVEIRTPKGEKVLWAALDNGIYIPNLCAIREADLPFGGCRLCLVEIEGLAAPVISCNQEVQESMVVHTHTERVDRLRRTAFEFLLSHHPLTCKTCAKNKDCALQEIAQQLGYKLKLQRLKSIPRSLPVDDSHPDFIFDPNKCVLCGKCVWACTQKGTGELDFAFRGIETRISPFENVPMADVFCNSCFECIRVCPVAAFILKKEMPMKAGRGTK